MKQYQLWIWSDYYPDGGWGNFAGSFDSIEEAEASVAPRRDRWDYLLADHVVVTVFDAEKDQFVRVRDLPVNSDPND